MLLEFWYWWILALLMLGVEMLLSGFFFLWLAFAAVVTGIACWLFVQLVFEGQLLLFSLLALCSLGAWRHFHAKAASAASDQPLLNQRGAQYVGRVFVVHEAIVHGQGKIKADDSLWKVTGPDCPVGTRVKIIALRDMLFAVELLEDGNASVSANVDQSRSM